MTIAPNPIPPKRRQCASDNGYRIHLKLDELACDACLEAHRIAGKDWRERTGRARRLKPCGTRAAYKRHLRAGERACWRCTWANRYGRDFVGEQERQDGTAA